MYICKKTIQFYHSSPFSSFSSCLPPNDVNMVAMPNRARAIGLQNHPMLRRSRHPFNLDDGDWRLLLVLRPLCRKNSGDDEGPPIESTASSPPSSNHQLPRLRHTLTTPQPPIGHHFDSRRRGFQIPRLLVHHRPPWPPSRGAPTSGRVGDWH
jgi:hypothetical protein